MKKNKELSIIQQKATSLIVSDETSLKIATKYLSQANKQLDAITADKETLTKPLNKTLKDIRAKYKPVEDALNAVISDIRAKMSEYQTRLINEQENQKQAIVARIKAGKGNLTVETALSRIENIESPEKIVETEAGTVQFVAIKKFEVVSLQDLPLEYHLPNETKIRQAMQNGEAELAGVKYWTEQSVRNSR